ncbi:hypothetical protein [Archangium violaceum]|uniref:hypothetical protein n=1 Tax=Archangium violaceum TaxID=83451 RepID=UPI001EEFD9E9|nr:hypothetical protein [Archangium violaceum]
MQCHERAEGISLTGGEYHVREEPGLVDNLWRLEQAPAGGGDISSGNGGEELLEEHVALMLCPSLEQGARLAGSEARGGTEVVRRIRLEVPDTGECLHPIADHRGLVGARRDTEGLVARVEPAAPEGHGTAGRAGEHGELGDALLAPALMPFQFLEDRGIAPDVGSGRGHGPKRP